MPYIGQKPHNKVVTASEISDGIITADKLASDSVTTAKIADTAVTTAKITDANITTAKIAGDAITDAKVADDVIGTEHLTAGEVDTTALGADAVTEAKIADTAIENEHLNVNVITGQTAETSVASDDTILIHDTSASALRKMTKANFTSGVGGLTLISTHTETSGSAATIDMNGVFTSSYDRYRINIDQFNMASPSTLLMQLGSGGTVATGIYQFVGLGFRSDNTEIRGNTNSATAINLQAGTGSDYQSNSPAGTPTAF